MDDLGTGKKVVGIIHGDMMQANYLIHHRRIHIIDFADFGLGCFLYDIAITLFALWGLDAEDKQRQAFLTGYREIRDLSAHHQRLLNVFIAARGVVQARFVMASDHPEDQRIAQRYIRYVGNGLQTWLAGKY
jgi:Ser/Thr protein kinase RdoA (MazF antagonist)